MTCSLLDTLREESLDSIQLIMPLLMHYLKVMLDNRAKELKRAKSVSSPGMPSDLLLLILGIAFLITL